MLSIALSLQLSGHELKKEIATRTGLEVSRLKLISCGHVIEDRKALQEQHLRVGYLNNILQALVSYHNISGYHILKPHLTYDILILTSQGIIS